DTSSTQGQDTTQQATADANPVRAQAPPLWGQDIFRQDAFGNPLDQPAALSHSTSHRGDLGDTRAAVGTAPNSSDLEGGSLAPVSFQRQDRAALPVGLRTGPMSLPGLALMGARAPVAPPLPAHVSQTPLVRAPGVAGVEVRVAPPPPNAPAVSLDQVAAALA